MAIFLACVSEFCYNFSANNRKEVVQAQLTFEEKLCKGRIVYDNLAKLQNEIAQTEENDLLLDITTEGSFGRTFLFLIPCLYYLADQYGKQLKIQVSNKIYENLGRLSFIETGDTHDLGIGNKMRFVRLATDENTLSLAKLIVKDIPVNMSPRLNEDMISKIGEMFNNAREHSNARHVLGGRYRKAGKRFCFACYDTGVGIPDRVQRFLADLGVKLNDEDALRWAMQPFHSTALRSNNPRGQGFQHLKNFASSNHGVIRICTGKVLYTYNCTKGDPEGGKFQKLRNSFLGTLFEMDIKTDDRRYLYKGELS